MLVVLAGSYAGAQETESRVNKLADRFVTEELLFNPTLSYSTGVMQRNNSRFADHSVRALAAHYSRERKDLRLLRALPIADIAPKDRATYATLLQQLESTLQLRVCRTGLWSVNYFDGWQSHFVEVADHQPVSVTAEKKQAIQRWMSLPQYLDVEIANLRFGLEHGIPRQSL